MVGIIQINLRKMDTARRLLTQTARDRRADMLIFSEQLRSPPDDDRCRSSTDESSQIFLTDTAQLAVVEHISSRVYVGLYRGGGLTGH